MSTRPRWMPVGAGIAILALSMVILVGAAEARVALPRLDGAVAYAVQCARCHGSSGRGDGSDAELFITRPRDLRSGFLRRYSSLELVDRIREGTRLNLAVDPAAVRARATDAEAVARYVERLPSVNWRLAERGEELFVDRCEICHGPFGRPTGLPPPGVGAPAPTDLSAAAFQARASDDIARTIRRGHGSMPGLIPRVEAGDVPALVAFIRLLSPGYERYSRYCAGCHGDDGRGPGVRFADDGLRAPAVVFDADYLAHHDLEHLRASVWHMLDEQHPQMPHLKATLSPAEARAIVAYLKRFERLDERD